MKNAVKRTAITLAALLFWIGVWFLLAEKAALSVILPSPAEVFPRLWELGMTSDFYRILALSFLRVMTGFAAGMALGFLFGTLSHSVPLLRALIAPLMGIIRATPVASFILVVLFFMETGTVPTFISLLMVLPIVWQNTMLGFEKRDEGLREMARVFRISPLTRFFRIDLPQVLSFTLSAGKTGLGLAWKAGVAAEVLALVKDSVGYMIYNAKMYLETVDLYAWTVAIILFSVILEKLFELIFMGRRRQDGTSAKADKGL